MHKHSTVILLGILVVFLSACILWDMKIDQKRFIQLENQVEQLTAAKNQEVAQGTEDHSMDVPDGGTSDHYGYLFVPELGVRFKKVEGATVVYTYDAKTKTVTFSTQELRSMIARDSGMASCEVGGFPRVALSSVAVDRTEFQGYKQVSLGEGKYLNIYSPQSVCYDSNATKADIDAYYKQSPLLNSFVQTAESASF